MTALLGNFVVCGGFLSFLQLKSRYLVLEERNSLRVLPRLRSINLPVQLNKRSIQAVADSVASSGRKSP